MDIRNSGDHPAGGDQPCRPGDTHHIASLQMPPQSLPQIIGDHFDVIVAEYEDVPAAVRSRRDYIGFAHRARIGDPNDLMLLSHRAR